MKQGMTKKLAPKDRRLSAWWKKRDTARKPKQEAHAAALAPAVQEEPAGEAFFKMQKLLTQQRYGEVLSALGVPGSFVSDRRKREFFDPIPSL